VVRAAIDMNVQHAAEDAIENQLRQFGRDYQATQAATVVAISTAACAPMVGGRDYGASRSTVPWTPTGSPVRRSSPMSTRPR